MINLVSKGIKVVGVGSLLNMASTFVENGPSDELGAVDAYAGPSGGGGRGGSGAANRNGPFNASSLGFLDGGGAFGAGARGLWDAVVCGQPLDMFDLDDFFGRRMDMSSLWLRSTGCTAEDIVDLLTVKDGKLTLDRDEIEGRLNSVLGPAANMTDDATKLAMVAAIAAVAGTNLTTAKMIFDTGEAVVDEDNYKDAESFVEMLKGVSGNSQIAELLDMEAEFAVLDSLIMKAVALGIPQAVDKVLGMFEDDKQRRRALLRNLRHAAMNSDLETIRKAVNELGRGAVISRVPDMIDLIVMYYRKPRNLREGNYITEADYLISTLSMVDPNWNMTTRSDVSVYSLSPYSKSSKDATEMFKRKGGIHQNSSMIASDFPQRHIQFVAIKYNPEVVI